MSIRTTATTVTDANLAPVDTVASAGHADDPIDIPSDDSDPDVTFRHTLPDWDSADDDLPLCKY